MFEWLRFSDAMNLRMKRDRVTTARETCAKMLADVCDADAVCRRTAEDLDSKIGDCESIFHLTEESRYVRSSRDDQRWAHKLYLKNAIFKYKKEF